MFEFLRRRFSADRESVVFDDERITRTMSTGQVETVRWEDLREIRIVTTNEGPFVDDVFWLLLGDESGCVVPSEAEGTQALLKRLQQLPDFDDEAVIRAMGCTDDNSFLIWHCGRKKSGGLLVGTERS